MAHHTYVFVPTSSGIFWLLISLYFYYWIGSTLERQWGTAKFTLTTSAACC